MSGLPAAWRGGGKVTYKVGARGSGLRSLKKVRDLTKRGVRVWIRCTDTDNDRQIVSLVVEILSDGLYLETFMRLLGWEGPSFHDLVRSSGEAP